MDFKNSVEATGEDVETAVAAGLKALGVGPGDVLVEVLEEPSRGVFGIGARPALVRLKLLRTSAPPPPPPPPQVEAAPVWEAPEAGLDDEDVSAEPGDEGAIAKEVLGELLQKMGVRGTIHVSRSDSKQQGESAPWVLDISGPDMRLLIGRRGDTLNALQYITRLIVSRKVQQRSSVIVDAGEYKSRRSERLEQLATRMADQALQQKRTVYLEPMPPNERRIIHMALRNREDVFTKSVGEGHARKVTIIPK